MNILNFDLKNESIWYKIVHAKLKNIRCKNEIMNNNFSFAIY